MKRVLTRGTTQISIRRFEGFNVGISGRRLDPFGVFFILAGALNRLNFPISPPVASLEHCVLSMDTVEWSFRDKLSLQRRT